MAYVRFSSDAFRSDVYVYDAPDGLVVHVASVRFDSPQPRPEPPEFDPALGEATYVNALCAYQAAISAWCDGAERLPINLPGAGESYTFADHVAAADFLDHLTQIGFSIPTFVAPLLRDASQAN